MRTAHGRLRRTAIPAMGVAIGMVIGWLAHERISYAPDASSEPVRSAEGANTETTGRQLPTVKLPKQTPVETAVPGLDEHGVPFLNVKGIGKVRHPVIVSYYALEYGGRESHAFAGFVPQDKNGKRITPDATRLQHCADVLAAELTKTAAGDWAWHYSFDSTYNDITVKQPWYSGFGQAVGIEALLASYEINGNRKHLAAAERAAGSLFRPLSEGGVLFTRGDDVFFEEIPSDVRNPGHIVNGHMRALMALHRLHKATGKALYAKWRDRGLDTLKRWLPLYDTGYWLRYDLNLKKRELAFRLRSRRAGSLAIERVRLIDGQTSKSVTLDIGREGDAVGPNRLAGLAWSTMQQIDGRSVRRFTSSPKTAAGAARDAFLYLTLPGDSADTLRTEPYLLEIEYYDAVADSVSLEIRSIAPGAEYRRLSETPMITWGDHRWRKTTIPISPTQLGWFVGEGYGRAHAAYLEELAEVRPSLKPWATKAWRYYRDVFPVVPFPTPSGTIPAVAKKPATSRR